jgi:hypothetical protein
MLHMTSSAPTRRLVLVPAEPRRSDAKLRRYRLARLRLEGRDVPRSERCVPRAQPRLKSSPGA